jgi:hypothetical protein
MLPSRVVENAIRSTSACWQVTSNSAPDLAPASIDTDRGLSPPTAQLARTSDSSTSWLPGDRLANAFESLVPIEVACPPSTVTV